MIEKKGTVEAMSRVFEKIGRWCFDHRWVVIICCAVLVFISYQIATTVRFDNSYESYFDVNDSTYGDFLEYRDNFGSDEIAYLMYEVPGKEYGPWDIDIMRKIEELTEELEDQVPFIKRVVSLSNAEFIEGIQDELVIHDLLLDFPESQEKLLEIRSKVMQKPIFQNGLVSMDGKYAAIIVEMDKASVDPLEEIMLDPDKGNDLPNLYPQATNKIIKNILEKPEYSGIKFYNTGDVPLNSIYNEVIQDEYKSLGLISLLITGILLLFFFRNLLGVIGPLLVVITSLMLTTGLIGILGWSYDMMFIMLPTILIAVGVADAAHILCEFQHLEMVMEDRREAIMKSVYLVGLPCFFTSITTVAGFSSMSVSPIKAIKHFAFYSAFGVFFAFLMTVTLLIAVLSIKLKKKHQTKKTVHQDTDLRSGFISRILGIVTGFDIRFKSAILIVFTAIFIWSAMGISRLKVDSCFLTEFGKDVQIRVETEFVDDIMGGSGSVSYIFDAKTQNGILEPMVLSEIEALQKMADQQEIVMKTYSIVDLLKDINKTLHNEDPAYYKLPTSRKEAAQFLLIYEMSGGDELENYITSDYSMANLEVRCKMVETSRYKSMVNRLDDYLKTRPNDKMKPRLTGMGALWVRMIEYIVKSQLYGFLLAYSVIAVMLCLLFRSIKIGMISMVPNLAPVVITLGIMGWAGIPLDYIKLLIGCVAIGIAVDDTIHLIMRYHYEFRQCGDYKKALKQSMNHVGRALYITTAVLVSGFLVFLFSIMAGLNNFGTLVASTIFIALIADFFLMPALVMVFKPFGPEFQVEEAL